MTIKKNGIIGKIENPGQELFIHSEISENQIKELYSFAKNDPVVIRNTSDPTRFNNISTFSDWAKDKNIYTLSDKDSSFLGGIIWLERKKIPERSNLNPENFEVTIGLRIYGDLRGKGLALPFVTECLKYYFNKIEPDINGIWLETSFDNEPIKKTFAKLGFTLAAEKNERGKILMIGKVKDTKINTPHSLL